MAVVCASMRYEVMTAVVYFILAVGDCVRRWLLDKLLLTLNLIAIFAY